MKKRVKSIFKIAAPLAIGAFFIFLSFKTTTPQDRKIIVSHMRNADMTFVYISVILGVLSHLSRAFRWNYLLAPLGYRPRFTNSVLAILVAYFANLGIPRSGEILRATTMTTYENIPFEKGFGTIIAERFLDLLILMTFVLIALIGRFDLIWPVLSEKRIDTPSVVAILFLILLTFFAFRYLFKKSSNSWILKLRKFLRGLLEGISTLGKIPNKIPFIIHTIFIWFMYVAMFYVVKWAIPETSGLDLISMFSAFVVGALTMSATNGGIGIYPFSVALTLSTFGISKESTLAFGWIMWTSQTVMVVVFGGLAFFILPLVNSRSSEKYSQNEQS